MKCEVCENTATPEIFCSKCGWEQFIIVDENERIASDYGKEIYWRLLNDTKSNEKIVKELLLQKKEIEVKIKHKKKETETLQEAIGNNKRKISNLTKTYNDLYSNNEMEEYLIKLQLKKEEIIADKSIRDKKEPIEIECTWNNNTIHVISESKITELPKLAVGIKREIPPLLLIDSDIILKVNLDHYEETFNEDSFKYQIPFNHNLSINKFYYKIGLYISPKYNRYIIKNRTNFYET